MIFSDPISELLIKLKNAQLARKDHVVVYYSKLIETILNILKNKGFIEDFKICFSYNFFKLIKIFLYLKLISLGGYYVGV